MAHWILILSADLKRREGTVCVGPETARICAAAEAAARIDTAARICVPAGWHPRFQVWMGDEPVRAHLRDVLGIENRRIEAPSDHEARCNTNGEMDVFCHHLFRCRDAHPQITMFVRHWHAPRARRLLEARLDEYAIRPSGVTVERVGSAVIFDRLLEPLKLVNEVRRKNLDVRRLFSKPAFL